MKKIYLILLGAIAMVSVTAFAAPVIQYFTNIAPFTNNYYDNGTSTNAWKNVFLYNERFSTTTTGCFQGKSTGASTVTGYFTGTDCGSGSGSNSFTWPFTANANYVSTTTTLGLLNGFFSTASSTISAPFRLSTLSDGELATYSGLVGSYASTTFSSPLVYTASTKVVNCPTCNTSAASVTSVAQTVPVGFTVSGSPITTSGTLAILANLTPFSIVTVNSAGTGLVATTSQLTVGSLLSTTTSLSSFAGPLALSTTTLGCTQIGANGVIYSTGSACGTGSGTVTSQPAGSIGYYNATGNTITGTSTNPLYLGSVTATSTTATSTFLGNVLISDGTLYGFLAGAQPLQMVGTANLPFQSIFVNKSTGGNALVGMTLGNAKTINNANPFAVTYYSGLYMAGSEFNLYPGLQKDNLVLTNSDSNIRFAALSTNIASSTMTWSVGPGFTTANYDMALNASTTGTAFLGIGTSTPQWTLQATATNTPQFALQGSNTDNIWTQRSIGGAFYMATASPTTFATTSQTVFSIDTNGMVGIGTTRPTEVNANAHFVVAGGSSQDIIASTTDNTTLSDAIVQAYAPGSRIFMGAHGTNQVSTRYGLTLGGWGEISAFNSSSGTTNGLVIGTNTAKPFVLGTNNVEIMRIDSLGYIGISTTTPQWELDLATSSRPQIALTGNITDNHWTLRGVGNQFSIATASPTTFATSTTDAFTITSNGTTTVRALNILNGASGTSTSAVGWNITTGCYAINGTCLSGSGGGSGTVTSVAQTVPVGFTISGSPVTTSGTLAILANLSPFSIVTVNSAGTGLVATTSQLTVGSLISTTTNTSFFNGNLGVGTSSAQSVLTVSPTIAQLSSAVNPIVFVGTSTLVSPATGTYFGLNAPTGFSGDFINFQSAGSVGYKVSSATTGLILLGTTTNSTVPGKLIIATTSTAQITLQGSTADLPYNIRSIGSTFAIATSSATTQATSSNNVLTINASGNVFFPTAGGSSASQTGYWCYDANRQLIADSAVCLVSARKFKKDIQSLDFGLSDLLKLKPISFKYKDSSFGAGPQMGFIADDIPSDLAKTLVTYDSTGAVHGFKYDEFTALLTKSIQDLNAKVDNMQMGKIQRSVEENYQDILIGLLIIGFIYQQCQIRKLKK